jgi:hypothetical protein
MPRTGEFHRADERADSAWFEFLSKIVLARRCSGPAVQAIQRALRHG